MAPTVMTSDDLESSFQGDATFNSLLQANGACQAMVTVNDKQETIPKVYNGAIRYDL